MATSYTSLLGLALPQTGDLSGTWGATVNTSITQLLDDAVAGTTTLSADTTLTTTTGASNQARQAILLCTGHVANITITAPAQSKIYTVINASATYTVKIRGAGPTTGITIPVSSTATVAWNGSDFVDASGYINGNLKVNGTLTVTGTATIGGNTAVTGTLSATGDSAFGASSTAGFRLYAKGASATSSDFALVIQNSTPTSLLTVRNDGYLGFGVSATAMTLDASGNLLVGATSNARSARIVSENASGQQLALRYTSVATWYQNVNSSGILVWDKDNTEAMRLNTTLLTVTPGASIQGLTVGLGGGAVGTNTAVGASAIAATATGTYATAIGYAALPALTSGLYNTAVGANSLALNQGGSSNSALGVSALGANVSGNYNTGIGADALRFTTGSNNTGVGYQAGFTNAGGNGLTAMGYQAGYFQTAGNTAIGYQSMYGSSGTGGYNNTAVGQQSAYRMTSGTFNVAVGQDALYNNTTASCNTAVGYQAGYSTTGAHNTALGYSAGNGISTGNNNSGFGSNSIGASSSAGVSGSDNTSGGYQSLLVLSSGANNTALGSGALRSNTLASNNTAVGYQAGYNKTGTGNDNVFIGRQAGYYVTTGAGNTYVGAASGPNTTSATTGSNNTTLGYASGSAITTGSKNTIIGAFTGNQGGLNIIASDNYIVLSDGDGNPRGFFASDIYYIGASSGGNRNWQFTGEPTTQSKGKATQPDTTQPYGYFDYYFGNTRSGYIIWDSTSLSLVNLSDYRKKENIVDLTGAIERLQQLKPRAFNFKSDPDKTVDGFVAHELAEVIPQAVFGEKDAVDELGEPVYQAIDQSKLIPLLVASIQELKAEIDSLKSQLNGA